MSITPLGGSSHARCLHMCMTSAVLQVGRPRPNFLARCFPDTGREPVFKLGVPQCQADNVAANTEGRKSFPSGARMFARPAVSQLLNATGVQTVHRNVTW